MRIETVSIATDSTPLDGLLYLPDGEVRGAVQLMHGNTMNFYVGPPRFLPPQLTELGLACLSYNRRGHDVLSNRDTRDLEGGAYQTMAEAIEDNALARRWMDDRGLPAPFVIGHSNGGMLAVRHAVDFTDTPALVLLSAHRGGRTIMRLMADNCPDVVELSADLECETFFLRSEDEPMEVYPAEEIASRSAQTVEISVEKYGGHYYVDHEALVTTRVTDWLAPRI